MLARNSALVALAVVAAVLGVTQLQRGRSHVHSASLLQWPTGAIAYRSWTVPKEAMDNTGSTYFAAGKTMRQEPVLNTNVPRSVAGVMYETAADRRTRYADHGYAWHDPKYEGDEKLGNDI